MRRKIDWIILFIVLCAAVYETYTNRAQLLHMVRVIKLRTAPCSIPITYSIGSVDPRFGISAETLAGELREAGALWDVPARRNLFEFTQSSGDVTVNLVYDNRQAAADILTTAGIRTDQTRESYADLKQRYDALSLQVEAKQAVHELRVAAYKEDVAAYNSAIQRLNRAGSASPADRSTIRAGKAALGKELGWIKYFEAALNTDIDTLNALATALNQLIVLLNLNVEQYNRTGAEMGVFEQGLYQRIGGVQTIDIYEYSSHAQLVRVLAHELGHALGLDHVAEAGAIMYKMNQGDSLRTADADIAELNKACHQ